MWSPHSFTINPGPFSFVIHVDSAFREPIGGDSTDRLAPGTSLSIMVGLAPVLVRNPRRFSDFLGTKFPPQVARRLLDPRRLNPFPVGTSLLG